MDLHCPHFCLAGSPQLPHSFGCATILNTSSKTNRWHSCSVNTSPKTNQSIRSSSTSEFSRQRLPSAPPCINACWATLILVDAQRRSLRLHTVAWGGILHSTLSPLITSTVANKGIAREWSTYEANLEPRGD